jgi:WXXGXW repeat (2 copies)
LFSIVVLSAGLAAVPLLDVQAQVICNGNASPPPELPVYDQPPIPAPGYIWTPGYWSGGPLGYFWVPGTWVEPPAAGLLWTPGYWAWRDGIYVWNAGYWGPHIGFYGGVDYGFGYDGNGYEGGRWVDGVFSYNETVNNFGGVHVTNVYNQTIVVNNVTRVSFNGGTGGIAARPTAQQEAVAREQHVAAIPAQIQHERTAGANKELLATENHGRPAIAATAKPGEFQGNGVVAAREVKPGEQGLQKPNNAMRPAIIGNQPMQREGAPNNAMKPAVTGKPMEREEAPKARETVKQEEAPKANETVKREVPNRPVNNAVEPNNNKPAHNEAKLPAEAPKLREKPPQAPPAAGNPPPKTAAAPNNNPKPKPGPNDKKPPQ